MEHSSSSPAVDPQSPTLECLMADMAAGHVCTINSPCDLAETLDIAGSCIGQALNLLFTEIDYRNNPAGNGAVAVRLLGISMFELNDAYDILKEAV